MAFNDFPSVGVWQIKFHDDNETNKQEYSQHVYVTKKMDKYYIMRHKTEDGWKFLMAEDYSIWKTRKGWSMSTFLSIINITDAFKVIEY